MQKSRSERKKKIYELLRSTEQNFTQENVRHFFAAIKKYKRFNPMLKAIKDKNDRILIEPQAKPTVQYHAVLMIKQYYVVTCNITK
jgi:Lhr-like helicase